MSLKRILLVSSVFLYSFDISSQNNFFDVDSIREIRLYFYDTSWDYILDSLYVLGNNDRLLADIIIDGNNYDSVGVRYKGFSSVSTDRIKNPFNIKLDYIIEDQDHNGVEKLKLANGYQDPSFIREVLSYEICRKYMPSSEANYANLYINDTLWGLYTNVEAVNKDFLIDHFDSKYNSFFKCNPENINIQIGGLNSDLSNLPGNDTIDYYPYYSIKSDHGWKDLYNLIDTLNNFQDSIHQLLNIDRVLWMHALNYTMINFDSYIGYAQNYYLYKDQANQWNPIIWDQNMSFGGFRLTDASQLYFSGFDIIQAQNMDPLTHYYHTSQTPFNTLRPLLKNIFSSERNRKMYLAHIRTIVNENFINQSYFNRAQYMQNLIDQSVQNDLNKFYTYSDFINNLNNQIFLPNDICPGVTQLMDARSIYLSSYTGYSGEPVISNISYTPQNFVAGNDVWITVDVLDASYVMLVYRFGNNMRFQNIEMYDDGNHNDAAAGDGLYGAKISNSSNSIDYYIYADNDSSGVFFPERAAYEYYNISSNIQTGDLVINELMANNTLTVQDNSGNYDDWIEIYNTTSHPISTKGLFLTDWPSNLLKWELPDHLIPSNGYCIIWADEDGNQGEMHANFKLSNIGEQLILSYSDGTVIDSITYPSQSPDISYARSPNGIGPFTMMAPTFNYNNDITSFVNSSESFVQVYPNPFANEIIINTDDPYYIKDIYGRVVVKSTKKRKVNTTSWKPGIYFINLYGKDNLTFKIIKI